MNAPVLVQIPDDWIQRFLTAAQLSGTQLGGWIATRAGRFRPPRGSRLRCEMEIMCRYEALNRPLLPGLEAEALSILAQLPIGSRVQVGFLTKGGALQPLMGGEPGLPGTVARIDLLKEAAACFALEQFIPDSTRHGFGLAFGTAAAAGTIVSPANDKSSEDAQEPYALPNCVRFACTYNRETVPDDPFQFLDLLLQTAPVTELAGSSSRLAGAARAELMESEPPGATPGVSEASHADATSNAGLSGLGTADRNAAARQLYGIAAYTTTRRPALMHGFVRHADMRRPLHPGKTETGCNTPAAQATAQVLVCTRYLSEYEALLEQAEVLIEEDAGRLSAGALAARRHKVPCINGISGLTQFLYEGSEVFVDQRQGIITAPHQ